MSLTMVDKTEVNLEEIKNFENIFLLVMKVVYQMLKFL